mgnify:CR=1 FL=1
MDNFIKFISTIFMLTMLTLGINGIVYSGKKLADNFSLKLTGVKTIGRLNGNYSNYSSSKNIGASRMYTPIIEYKDSYGKQHQLISDYSSSVPENYDEISVYYSLEKPYKAVQADFMSIFGWPFLILLLSLLALGIGLYFMKIYIIYFFRKKK